MTKLPPEESVIRIPSHVSWYLNFVVRRSDSISTSRASWGHQGISWHLHKNGLSLPKRMIHWRFDLTQKWDQTTDTGTANPSKHHSTALNDLTIWYSKHLEKCQFREIASISSPDPPTEIFNHAAGPRFATRPSSTSRSKPCGPPRTDMWVWWRMEWDESQNFSKFSRSNCQTVGWIYKGISLLMTLRNTWQCYILVAKAKWMRIQAMNVRDKISHMTCHQERNLQQVCSNHPQQISTLKWHPSYQHTKQIDDPWFKIAPDRTSIKQDENWPKIRAKEPHTT